MSNLGAFGGAKNPPWVRTSAANSTGNLVNQNNALQQQLLGQGALGNMGANMVQFQPPHQQQVFQNMGMQQQNLGLGLQQMGGPSVAMGTQLASGQLFQPVGAVTYPNPRALNPTAFQTQTPVAVANQVQQQANQQASTKQRVFTGTVTKVHDNFGFVDEDVFFQTSACVKGSNPMVGDRVLVEASYNPSMPFKWNATRIQVLPTNQTGSSRNSNSKGGSVYSAVPPPCDNNFGKGNQRAKASLGGRGRERSRDRDRDEEEMERKKRREERLREREKEERKSPLRRRSRSPKNRRRLSRVVPRYMVQIPKINLDLLNADVLEVRRRYANLYIPSDFFCSYFRWVEAFSPDKPFSLSKPCQFHIMHKDVDPIAESEEILEPPDADYLFSAKVMLLSVPGMEELYQKCCAMAEDRDKRDRDSEERDFVHPTRLINFLVGLRGKNETMAIGGPWSPSLDGENPESDPTVLIRTAIRTCKALTGIDLSSCTQWYRFVELYYRRGESVHKGKSVPARVETVALFLPDAWSCLPTRIEWDHQQVGYRAQLERKLRTVAANAATATATAAQDPPDDQPQADEKEEEPLAEGKIEPTHHLHLDPKTMNVNSLRGELKARNISSKGLKSQLVARLTKCLKVEAERPEEEEEATAVAKETSADVEADVTADEKKLAEPVDEKQLDEKEKALMEKRYTLPEQPHIVVHPSRTAKNGKFDCTTMSLSLLLDYRPEDTKEHSFEVSLFAELFNEMLTRDFGFNIYKALYELPEKVKEKDEKKRKEDEKKGDDDKDKDKKGKDEDRRREDEGKRREDRKEEKERRSEDKKGERKEEEKKREGKKEERKLENVEESDEEEDYEEEGDNSKDKKKSDKERKKKERPKMYTKDRNLLLSFVYFDQTHCGYIFEKDMEDLLFTLGLHLSRAQVRKLVGKVISRDSLHYRKLTDKPKEDDLIVIDDSERDMNVEQLANGNKNLLPVFKDHPSKKCKRENATDATNDEGVVVFRGAVVDVSKLMAQLERSDKARIETEERMIDLKTENTRLTEKNTKINSTIKSLNSELKDYKERLKVSEDSLIRSTARSKLFQATLTEVRDKIDPVLKSTMYTKEENSSSTKKESNDKDRKYEEGKSRWEKNKEKEAGIKEEAMDIDWPNTASEIKEENKNEKN